ncbi:MAG: hypothetical protein K9J16_17735 [Melioribacteraceae bacterium]|nr:hypothetical protein [Melioribacteraceae bacterium]MCF8353562.1 hypothetical protein [Melioribacteraceae bacterium]MCF8393485.1 hypothetical protein [Melioribacteraceae bacterium]MCF8419295.1 hypothetical protein [Melioribacteraceae bacterium]
MIRYLSLLIKIIFFSFFILGCASIPPEAPKLSSELGERISQLENSNLSLLHKYFDFKRKAVDEFMELEWAPLFIKNFYDKPNIIKTWDEIVSSNNPEDRIKFLKLTQKDILNTIYKKRQTMINALNEIEKSIEDNIRKEFLLAKSVNNSITSYLLSASEVATNRDRLLNTIGVKEDSITNILESIDKATKQITEVSDTAESATNKIDSYINELTEIKNTFHIGGNNGN